MAVLATNMSGHLQNQLTRSLERILEDANQSGELKLSNRKLKDFPPTSGKYNLSDTVIADLSKNRFSELPEEITSFFFLEKLLCYHNGIRHIPDSVNNLQCLSYMDLSRNQLTTLPREICQLPIQILLVSNNKLSCLPDELSKMSQLTELDASCNQLTHLPPRMGELRNLQSLVLRCNLLLCVPVELTYLKLVRLDLRANRIGALPIELREMDMLIDLLIDDNPLTSPPASLCKRGRVHIFKYLDMEAIKLDRKAGIVTSTGTLSRRSRRSGAGSSPGPPSHVERLKNKRQNVDSGYSTSSDGFDKRWSQDLTEPDNKQWTASTPQKTDLSNGTISATSTPTTLTSSCTNTTHDNSNNSMEEDSRIAFADCDKKDDSKNGKDYSHVRLTQFDSQVTNGNGLEEKSKPLQQIQTYREYKEALKQQRAQDVPSIYRTKENEDQSYKTEPNTPTHHSSPGRNLSTSKSDPTPLNSALSSPKHIFDDTLTVKKPVQKVQPSRNCNTPSSYSPSHTPPLNNGNLANELGKNQNGMKYIQDYVKPQSPLKSSSGILSHDNVPIIVNNQGQLNGKSSPRTSHNNYVNGGGGSPKNVNGVNKGSRTISWDKDVPAAKMSFTMRREIDKAREETDLINQLRNIIESRLKMVLPEDLAPILTDGVVLCHLANHIKPRSVASIHVPSPAVPKLTMARCRRNVDNFIEACRKIGVDENLVCCAADVLEGRGLVQVAITVTELVRFHSPKSPMHSVSTII